MSKELNIPTSDAFDTRLRILERFAKEIINEVQKSFYGHLHFHDNHVDLDSVSLAFKIIKIDGVSLNDVIDKVHAGKMSAEDFFEKLDKAINEFRNEVIEKIDLKKY